jgi:Tfp pilus assembly protein PilX
VSSASCVLTGPSGTIKTSLVGSCAVTDSTTVSNITAQSAFTLTCGALVQTVIVNIVPKFKEF